MVRLYISMERTDKYMKKMMNKQSSKYLIVLPSLNIGGAEKQALGLAIYLKNMGRNVTILSNVKRGPICDLCENEHILWNSIEHPNMFLYKILRCLELIHILPKTIRPYNDAMAIMLAKYIKGENFDYCLAYCSNSGVWLGRAAKYYHGAKYAWYQRDAGIFNSGDEYEKSAIKACDFVLANSVSGKQYIEKQFKVATTIINNGVKLKQAEMSSVKWKEKLKVADNVVLCTMVANLHSAKDHLSILKIWDGLKRIDSINTPILILAGRFDDKYQELLDFTKEHGLEEYVRFLGPISDITGLLSVTDICVFGAKSEGSPNGIIEATLMSLPVMATDLPEIRAVVSDNNVPFLFNKDDIEDGVSKMRQLIVNPNLRYKLGCENLEKSKVEFDEERNFKKLIQLLEG